MTSHGFCLFEILSRKKPGNVLIQDIHCPWLSLHFSRHCSFVFIFRKENKTIF